MKHRSKEDAQWIPDDVFEAIAKLKYPATPRLLAYLRGRRTFDCAKQLRPVIEVAEKHIAEFDRAKAAGLEDPQVPPDIDAGDRTDVSC